MRILFIVLATALLFLTACEGTRHIAEKDYDYDFFGSDKPGDGDVLLSESDELFSDLDEEPTDEDLPTGDGVMPEEKTDTDATTDDGTVSSDEDEPEPDIVDEPITDEDAVEPADDTTVEPDATEVYPELEAYFPDNDIPALVDDATVTDDDPTVTDDDPTVTDEDTAVTDTAPVDDIVPDDASPETDIIDNDDLLDDAGVPDIDTMLCSPGEFYDCPYSGDPKYIGVGACHAGVKECAEDGMSFGDCWGEVLPSEDTCDDGIDNDCEGHVDNGTDPDGDGWGTCNGGDCCESELECENPTSVNPGAIEVEEDGVDNNCNEQTDENPYPDCSSGDLFTGTEALDLVYGMDICRHSTDGSWGIVGTPILTRASETGTPSNLQISLMAQFGTDASNIYIKGGNMSVISSGRARDEADPDPTNFHTFEYEMGTPPPDFIAAHGGLLPSTGVNPINLEPCVIGDGANDAVMLTVQLKVPSNAYSFSFNYRFFTQGYWRKTCKKYNDFFITMLYTGWQPGADEDPIPADRNIAFDSIGNYISVNTNEFFTSCEPQIDLGYPCPDGTAALEGTGYKEYTNGALGVNKGGATKWLATTAPVVPGETITLKFVVWDTTDMLLDSLVLLDNFKWSTTASGGPVTSACWDLNHNGACEPADEDVSGDGLCTERDC